MHLYNSGFTKFYILLESLSLFWECLNKLQGFPKFGNLLFRNIKFFQAQIMIKKTASSTTTAVVNKPDIRGIMIAFMLSDYRDAMTYIDVLGN